MARIEWLVIGLVIAAIALGAVCAFGAEPPPIQFSGPPAIQFTAMSVEPPPLTYAQACALALKTGKPLIVWVSSDNESFCEQCVKDSATDFIHVFVKQFEGVTAPAIVVGVVDEGQMMRAGEVTWWVVGDREFGHVPSIRTVIRQWLVRRSEARDALRARLTAPAVTSWPATGYSASAWSASSYSYMRTMTAPVVVPRPVVRFLRGCSS